MAKITIDELSDGVIAETCNMFQARYGNTETFKTPQEQADYISKVMSFELQELCKQFKRETAIAQANQEIEASTDFVETSFEAEQKAKAAALQTPGDAAVQEPKK